MKLRHALSQRLHLKGLKIISLRPLLHQPWITTKIALNIMKVGVHSYLPNAQINLWSNFNSKKLVKSETPLAVFAKVGLKWGENILECRESSHARLFIKCPSKSMIKFYSNKFLKSETPPCDFARIGLKEGQNSS